MVFVGTLSFFNAKNALENLRIAELTLITDLKVKKIVDFFAERKKDILAAQTYPDIKYNASLLADCPGNISDPSYRPIKNELDRLLKGFQLVYNYMNVILANSKRKIVYVLDDSASEYLCNYLPDPLRKTFEEGKDRVYFSDIFASPSTEGQFAVLVAAPVQNLEGKIVGIIAYEINMAPIYELIQDSTGLGQTGETLIARKVDNKVLFLNPLRHDLNAALKRTVSFGKKQAIPIQEALKGNDGHGLAIDYRGKEVIAAWRYIPDLNWGMVAKIDASEAFETAVRLRDFVLILVIAVMVLSIFVAFFVAKSISDPIQILHEGVEEIGRGNLDHEVGTSATDEIGQLGRAFDQMTQQLRQIAASRDDLDMEVKGRKKAEKALQKSMDELTKRVNELNCLYELSHLEQIRNLPLEKILQEIVELIPRAMRYPEITCAKIMLEEQEFKTNNFKETKWMLLQNIKLQEENKGILVVGHLEESPAVDEGSFLREETDLIAVVAERTGKIIERRQVQFALEESEKRFRDLVENSLTGISIIQNGRIIYQNPEQERLLGPLPRRLLFEDIEKIHQDDVEKVTQFYQDLISGQRQDMDTELRFFPSGKKGRPADMRWVHCRASMIEYQGKEAILLNIDEFTRAKRLENLLRIQDKMSSLGRVAAGIAHEIRNPLSGINIYLNTLKKLHHRDGSEQKVDQILDQLQSASYKIESVIRRVMDFSKPSEPKLSLININVPISEAIDLSAVSLRKRGIKIKKKLAENLPLCHLDPQLIEQVMLNLIANAAEAMKYKEDNGVITVASAVERDHIQVKVSDSGPGVPPDMREMIFDPFYTTKNDSSGIGLSISHRIITDHGGSLSVSDSELGGAEFRIEIPIDK